MTVVPAFWKRGDHAVFFFFFFRDLSASFYQLTTKLFLSLMELHSTSLEMTEREVAATLRTTFMSMPTASPARRKSQALTHSISTIPGSEEELQTFAEMDSPVSPTIDNQKRPRKRPRLADTPESGADAPESDIRRHQCSYPGCDKRYRKKNKLDEHVRSHTGEVCTVNLTTV